MLRGTATHPPFHRMHDYTLELLIAIVCSVFEITDNHSCVLRQKCPVWFGPLARFLLTVRLFFETSNLSTRSASS